MNDTPNYAHWERQPLVEEATRLYLLVQTQADVISHLRLASKDAIAAYRALIIQQEKERDDWK